MDIRAVLRNDYEVMVFYIQNFSRGNNVAFTTVTRLFSNRNRTSTLFFPAGAIHHTGTHGVLCKGTGPGHRADRWPPIFIVVKFEGKSRRERKNRARALSITELINLLLGLPHQMDLAPRLALTGELCGVIFQLAWH